MNRFVCALALSLALGHGLASPAAAHKPRVFVPQPRQVTTEVEYRVVILASNLGAVPRRFHVSRIVPQPLGEPLRQMFYGAYVQPGDTHAFSFANLNDSAGLLEIIGAPQIVIRARLEIWDDGTRIHTTPLPAVAAREHEEGDPVIKHAGKNDLHLQGLSRMTDGSITTDMTIVNFDAHHEGECAMSIVDSNGEGILGLPFLHVPAGAAIAINDVLAETGAEGDLLEAWGAFACEQDTFTIWAAVYRNGGREVEYVLPSAELR
jgi:hypothetical protein